jgi:hypothetical protein
VILLYLAGLAALVAGGAGPLSVDAWRRGFRRPELDAVHFERQ